MHVAIHALRCWYRAGEYVAKGVPLFLDRSFIMARLFHSAMAFVIMISRLHLIGNGRVNRLCLSVAAILGIAQTVPWLAVIRIYNMACSTARMAIITRLIICPHEPHEWVV